jgi:hypothetical protein
MSYPTNFIKCKFCTWTTRKYGMGSNPDKAFVRLFKHIECDHPEHDDLLDEMRRSLIDREQEELERINGTG